MPFYYGKCSAAICVVLGSKKSTYVSEYASGFFEPQPRIYQQLLRLATKDYSDRLLAIHRRSGLHSSLSIGHFIDEPGRRNHYFRQMFPYDGFYPLTQAEGATWNPSRYLACSP